MGFKSFFLSFLEKRSDNKVLRGSVIWINVLILSFFILDRILKKIAISGAPKKILFIEFSLSKNPGIAFSIPFKGFFSYFLLIIILCIIVFGLLDGYRRKSRADIVGFSLIFAGAFSNLLDRFQYALVIDYFHYPLFLTVFNIADLMILGGVAILSWRIIAIFLKQKNKDF